MWMTAQDEESGFVLASTFVKKTEDQLDAYREWIFLILDHPQDMFGWTSKSKAKMERFKEDLVEQICEATEFPKARLRVVRVLKANKKKSWVALESKNPTFFLGKSLLIWLLPCRLFLHDCFVLVVTSLCKRGAHVADRDPPCTYSQSRDRLHPSLICGLVCNCL